MDAEDAVTPEFERLESGDHLVLGDAGVISFDVPAPAAAAGADATPVVVAAASAPRERHRVFVKSGVTGEVSEESLQRHFARYGTVTDVYIPRLLPSQLPKGFAYISFDSDDAVHRALELESHEISGKHFPVGRAESRPSERGLWYREQDNLRRQRQYNQQYSTWNGQEPCSSRLPIYGPQALCVSNGPHGPGIGASVDPPYNPEAPYYHTENEPCGWMPRPSTQGAVGNGMMKRNGCRIFVGGVPDVILEEDMKVHFEKYGKVEDVYFPKEKETRKRRGFCYVRFDNPKAADAAAARSPRTIAGNEIGEIKIAQPRPGEGSYSDYHHNRNDYGFGGYGPQRFGNSYNSRLFEGRPPTRFRPY